MTDPITPEIREAVRQAAREVVARRYDAMPQFALIAVAVREGRMDDDVAVRHAIDVALSGAKAAAPFVEQLSEALATAPTPPVEASAGEARAWLLDYCIWHAQARAGRHALQNQGDDT